MERFQLKRLIRRTLSERFLADGGIADRVHGQFRTDATAWGILAWLAAGGEEERVDTHRARLIQEQEATGAVSVSKSHPESFWPTGLAILAWQSSSSSQAAQDRAIHFLIEMSGVHRPPRPDEQVGHDPLLKGWPWVVGTHSWIEPTALNLLALKIAGYGKHDRVTEAIEMILNRQLLHGGWNYGNTLVFRRELLPMPESTGAALTGLAGMIAREKIVKSLSYLQGELAQRSTPIALGWTLLGLAAWGLWPSNAMALVERCLANQSRYGDYDTSALSLLFLGALAGDGDKPFPLFLPSSDKPSTRAMAG